MSAAGKVLLGIGVLVLVIGFAMPATQTQRATTCYDDPTSYGQSCAETAVETGNPARGATVGFGFLLAAAGGVVWIVTDGSNDGAGGEPAPDDESAVATASDRHEPAAEGSAAVSGASAGGTGSGHSLEAEIRKRQTGGRKDGSADAATAGSQSGGGRSESRDWNWEDEA